jgi:outer membrane protein TolC
MPTHPQRIFLLIFLISLCLTSCMVGPNFRPPVSLEINKSYTEQPEPRKTVSTSGLGQAGKSQYLQLGRDIPAEWWQIFHSKELTCLIQQGMLNSPNVQAAKAALTQAEELLQAQVASTMYPQITSLINVNRQRFSASQFGGAEFRGSIFNLFNGQLNVSYALDTFRRCLSNVGF